MSAVEQTRAPTASYTPRRVSSRFLRSELRLVFRRRRNLAGLAVLAAVPLFIAIATKVSSPGRGGEGPDFFGSITENGLFVALAALGVEIGLFLPLAVAAICGDAVAGEANVGTLRYLLTVPVDRARLLVVKYVSIVVFALAGVLSITVTGVLVGLALFGGGPLTLLSGTQVSFAEGLWRVLLCSLYVAFCLAALGSVGLFFSTLTEQPVAAMITTVIFSSASFILDAIPQVAWLHPYLLTHHWLDFGDLLRAPMDFSGVQTGMFSAMIYAVVFWLAAWARLTTKDVTS